VGQEKGRLIWPQAWPQTGKKSVGFTATACRVLLAARRTVLCSSAFSLAPPLRSTGCGGALFARFLATSGRPTSPSHSSSATASGLPDNVPAATGGDCWRSPGSRAKGFCACQGLRRRGVGMCLAISTPAVLLSVGRKTSAPRTCLTPLNTSPAPSPVNHVCPRGQLVHHLGPVRFATQKRRSMSNISKFSVREWLVPPVLLPIFFGLLIAAAVVIQW
jgi:hypothetical protein